MECNPTMQERIAAEAAEWFARLQVPHDNLRVRAEFSEWILRSPEHVQEFLTIGRIWGEAGAANRERFSKESLITAALAEGTATNVVPILSDRESLPVSGSLTPARSRSLRYALAAVLLGVIAMGLGWAYFPRGVYSTDIGEQRSVTLADGSVVDINTHSKIQIDIKGVDQRRVRLLYGEGRFKVAKNRLRPFIVVTPQASIRVLGTVFNVRAESQRTAVAVLEGQVEVRELATVQPSKPSANQGTRIELKAGERAAVSREGHILPSAGPPLESVASWTERRLVFREEPLADVIAEFNRYHRRPIRIEGPELAGLKVSGTFDSSDPNSLIEYFQRFEGVRVEEGSDATRLLPPSSP